MSVVLALFPALLPRGSDRLALAGADGAVPVRIDPVEALQGRPLRLGESDPSVAIHVHHREGAAAETGHHSATAATAAAVREPLPAAFGPVGPALASVASAIRPRRFELGAADHSVLVRIEALEPVLAPLRANLAAVGAPRLDFLPGDEAVAIHVGLREAGLDLRLDGGTGLRLAEAALAVAALLGRDGNRGKRRQSGAGE